MDNKHELIMDILNNVLKLGRDLAAHAHEATGTPEQQRNYDAVCDWFAEQLDLHAAQLAAL